MGHKIIIDTDPGQDDALALLLAFASPEIEVLGVTTVAGNIPLELTQKNARKICELAGRSGIRVFAGSARPMVRDLVTAEYVHGPSGLDGYDLPDPLMQLQSQHAVDFIVDTLMAAARETVTLCPLGPLTNIGTALQKEPRIVNGIREIVLMGGGCFEGGNITPSAEFNIYVDPHAADIVMRSGVPIVMMPLDVTHKTLTTAQRISAIRSIGGRIGDAAAGWLEFFERFDESKYGTDGAPLHDPNVIAYLIKPSLYSGRMCNVEIELGSPLTLGQTVVDWWGVTEHTKNALFIRNVDADGFFELLVKRLRELV
ncbi:nucleoside hydrolase [Ochrobactrum sp. Marseille-Q0166]|uniref:nucleoside hydrolase n=1 Tax=Ochrobactrum sp. Marseille-Q0166 TaxID=2761105 RepID=UPI0016558AF9|nr:nucleoside hydrolase [Ochrobactrum sp. Marseille-Q0166]MBC8716384.1 nucleoside hydrolase [Ochrobactrum sp. Marseille-Q0166]